MGVKLSKTGAKLSKKGLKLSKTGAKLSRTETGAKFSKTSFKNVRLASKVPKAMVVILVNLKNDSNVLIANGNKRNRIFRPWTIHLRIIFPTDNSPMNNSPTEKSSINIVFFSRFYGLTAIFRDFVFNISSKLGS